MMKKYKGVYMNLNYKKQNRTSSELIRSFEGTTKRNRLLLNGRDTVMNSILGYQ